MNYTFVGGVDNNVVVAGSVAGAFIFVAAVAAFIIAVLIFLNHRKTSGYSMKEGESYWSRSNDNDYASTVAPTDNDHSDLELESKYNSEGRTV